LTYIDDCVQAHVLAMRGLEENPNSVGGKAYFISQGDPVKMWGWIDEVLEANGLAPVSKSISARTAMALAHLIEGVSRMLLVLGIELKPLLTRFLVSEMYTSHYFDISRARQDLDFVPAYSVAEALAKTFPQVA
jgi:nucleoside-diphosphate-sugar epimerase